MKKIKIKKNKKIKNKIKRKIKFNVKFVSIYKDDSGQKIK
jgi:hypothetical protein